MGIPEDEAFLVVFGSFGAVQRWGVIKVREMVTGLQVICKVRAGLESWAQS